MAESQEEMSPIEVKVARQVEVFSDFKVRTHNLACTS